MTEFGKICLNLPFTIISTIFGGFVFLALYDWFILVPFHAPSITLVQAIGLKLFISFTQPMPKPSDDETTVKTIVKDFIVYNFAIALIWGIAYIITLF